jgi:hypothetical protein
MLAYLLPLLSLLCATVAASPLRIEVPDTTDPATVLRIEQDYSPADHAMEDCAGRGSVCGLEDDVSGLGLMIKTKKATGANGQCA